MPQPGTIERPVFYAMPVWLVVAFYLLSAAALAVFVYGVYRKVRKYNLGRRDAEETLSLKRFGRAALAIISSRTVWREDWYAGLAHLFVLWGFGALFIATLMVLVDNDILGILAPKWRFLQGAFYLRFSWVADLFGLLLLVGLAMLILRRWLFRLPKLRYESKDETPSLPSPPALLREDWVFLLLLFVIGSGGFAVEALRIRATEPWFERVSFVGWGLSQWLAGTGASQQWARGVFPYLWCLHAVTALGLVAYIPYSKGWHMLIGWFSLALRKEEAARRLPAAIDSESGGYARIEDLTRGELVMLDACTRCGRCHAACPAATAGFPLSPRDLILTLRRFADAKTCPPVFKAWRSQQVEATPVPVGNPGNAPALAGDVVPKPWLWSCTTCFSCVDRCPVGVQHVPLVVQMRRYLVSQGEVDEKLQAALTNLTRYGNSFGKSPRQRPLWALAVAPGITDARKEPVDYLWVTGDYAAFDPRVQKVTQSAARVFQQGGLSVGLLYDAEQNSGNDLRRVGEEGLFDMLMEKNLKAFDKAQFEKIVTTDPHTYHALKNEYNWSNGNGGGNPVVLHHTELLDSLIQSGKLSVQKKLDVRATYHDPCYLGRFNDVYEAPRRLLQSLGVRLVEMPRNHGQSFCCGAGGGRIWMEDVPDIKERSAETRLREAAGVPGVSTLVVACPKDLVMFQDALKTTGLEGKLVVKDVVELVEEAMGDDHQPL